jgi:D-glycero-D-manno-heptose 1,7-bisphosphate phosphatase
MKSGVFFERDGVLNLVKVEREHQVTPLFLDEFQVNPAAVEPLQQLKAAGFVLLTTTNQPGLSRGYLTRRELDRMHTLLRQRLPLDDVLVCPHDETDHCPCRKPQTGLLTEAAFKWHLDLDRSYVVSDKWQDARAAHLAGCTSLLLKSPWIGKGHYDFVLSNLGDVVRKIEELQSSSMLLMDQP